MFNQCNTGRRKMWREMPFGKFAFHGNPLAGGLRRPKYNVPLNVADHVLSADLTQVVVAGGAHLVEKLPDDRQMSNNGLGS